MKWQMKTKAPGAFLKQFSQYSPLIARLLYHRDLRTRERVREFFTPDYRTDLHSPFLLKNMRRACRRIWRAVEEDEKILIYGDFDADGVCATAILQSALNELGARHVSTCIPHRDQGHGLNKDAVASLAGQTDLIVTVDCGSTDAAEIALACSLGIDVIVTDHHQVSGTLPRTAILVNPWQDGDKYPFKHLAGAGVAYKLACALLSKQSKSKSGKWLLDLTALATIADVMPLTGENRTLVKYGLGVLAQTKRAGLRKLMETACLKPQLLRASVNGEPPLVNLDAHSIGFILAPRLNAAGRMEHADLALSLLTTDDEQEAERLAKLLHQRNAARQNLTDKIVQAIRAKVESQLAAQHDLPLIFEGSPEWPLGLIGLAAGKIADRYGRPAVIYREEGGLIRASCRSIPQFDLMAMIQPCADFLLDFGGHRGGAGFQVKTGEIGRVKRVFNQIAADKLAGEDLTPAIEIDSEISLTDISWENYRQLQAFAPFGHGNPEPIFLTRRLEVRAARRVGAGGRHLKLALAVFDDDHSRARAIEGIGFNLGNLNDGIRNGSSIDAVFKLSANEWAGRRTLELQVLDLVESF